MTNFYTPEIVARLASMQRAPHTFRLAFLADQLRPLIERRRPIVAPFRHVHAEHPVAIDKAELHDEFRHDATDDRNARVERL